MSVAEKARREAIVMAIDSYTSREAQAIRSIRSNDTQPAQHAHHHGGNPQERVLEELEQFRVAALEKLASSFDHCIEMIAAEVLGRELQLAPADLQALIRQAMQRLDRESPVRVRVAPQDVATVQTQLPIVADAKLSAGDFVLEVQNGESDARLPIRFSCAVHRLQQPTTDSVYGEVTYLAS